MPLYAEPGSASTKPKGVFFIIILFYFLVFRVYFDFLKFLSTLPGRSLAVRHVALRGILQYFMEKKN